ALLSQFANPGLHASPHDTPSHVAPAFAGALHAVHDPPHVCGLTLLAHALPHAWKPALHAKRHCPEAHDAVAFMTSGQRVLQPPQWVTLVCRSTHWVPHRVGACAAQPVVHTNWAPCGPQSGAPAPHR